MSSQEQLETMKGRLPAEAGTAGVVQTPPSGVMHTLLQRNQDFSNDFEQGDLPVLPNLRAVILACVDARVDPAHVLGLALGDAVVIRNTGGRVTQEVVSEVATLAFMVSRMQGGEPAAFDLVVMHHTQCGAERFADPGFREALKSQVGVDVAPLAIEDHEACLREDLDRLAAAEEIPGSLTVSALMYDVKAGSVREVVPPRRLRSGS
ncbi:carbonic anhydrase [Rhodovibrionaceae bacterium A322]